MSSLDVLDYAVALEEALARQGMPAPLRRAAVKDARRVLEAMAFRFALMDERPLPEDLDHLRALEAMKPPDRAAAVLLRRRPVYAKARARRLATTWIVLGVLALAGFGFYYAITSEVAQTVAEINERADAGEMREVEFTLDENVTRLYVAATVVVAKGGDAGIQVRLVDPNGNQRLEGNVFTPGGSNYLRQNVDALPGKWTLRVLYDGGGSAQVVVNAVRPAR